MPPRILVVSARMGAGHDGAARELCKRLEALGSRTRLVDFLDAAPRIGRLLHRVYALQLGSAPWSYEATYRVWFLSPLVCRPVIALLAAIFGRRLRRWVRELDAGAVVSTYPLASVVLGHQRRRLGVPVVTFITDFAVHPLWVHPDVDLHLCVHPQSAEQAHDACGSPSRAPGPLVSDRFRSRLPGREEARARFGIPTGASVVLLVAGSWGVGELEQAFDDLARCGKYFIVAVCGANERLKDHLESRGTGLVFGWTDQMPALMSCADVLVQNGGGLTCMEAFASGLPVVSFRPIPGHGRQNAIDMERAGVAAFVRGSDDLEESLARVTTLAGRRMTALAGAMFQGDAAEDVLAAVAPTRVPAPARLRRRLATIAAACALGYVSVNAVAGVATASGVGTVRPRAGSDTIYVAVRLGRQNLADPNLPRLLSAGHMTAIVEGAFAEDHPGALRRLSAAGVDLANGGWASQGFHLMRAEDGVVRSSELISDVSRRRCVDFAPDQVVNGFDLASAHFSHQRVIHISRVIRPGAAPGTLLPATIYVVNAEKTAPAELDASLRALDSRLARAHLANQPLDSLH